MHRIDRLHIEFPFAGSRTPKELLVREGFSVGRLHVATLMQRMRDVYVVVKQRIACSPPDRRLRDGAGVGVADRGSRLE